MKFTTTSAEAGLSAALDAVGRTERIVLCGSPDERNHLEDLLGFDDRTTVDIIGQSKSIDGEAWFQPESPDEDEFDIDASLRSWPGELPSLEFTTHRDILSFKLLPEVLLAQFEADAAWHIPAHFKYGGWNECPDAAEHCAIWRDWQEKYGAEIVAVSHDVIEAWVPRPPTSREAAMTLAYEQFLYCSDIVWQGVGSIENLASTIIKSNVWYFWWD